MTTPCPSGAAILFPPVTVPLREVDNPLPPDVLCGRGGAAQRHAGNLHYRELIKSNKPYYCTCPKPEKLRISKSIVAAVRQSNGRFLERALDGLYYDIGDKKAVEKTSQALREGQPKLRKRIQELQEESGAAGLPDAVVVEGIVESHPNALCSTADVGDPETNVQAAAAGYRSPLLGEGGIAAAVFVPEGGGEGPSPPSSSCGCWRWRQEWNHHHARTAPVVSAEQAYGTLPGRTAGNSITGSGAGTPASSIGSSDPSSARQMAAQAMAQAQAQYHPESVQRTPSGTPYLMAGGGGGTTEGADGGMELSKESIRNLQAEAATGTYGAVPTSTSATTSMSMQQQQQNQVQMQLYQQQLELKRRQQELREQQRLHEEKERTKMMGRYQLGVDDLEPTPMESIGGGGGGTAGGGGVSVGVGNAIGKGGSGGLHIDIGASPTNGNGNADRGMFADISPIALPDQYHHQRDVTLRTGNHGGGNNGAVDVGDGGGKRPSLEGFRPPSFKTRSIAEEIQYQQEELRRMQEEAQAQQLRLQQEQQRYYHQQQQQQAQLAGQQPMNHHPVPTQQTSNNTLSQISLMSTFSAIGDSAMSLGMLVSDREVGDASAGGAVAGSAAAPATNSPAALTAAARAQAPQSSVVQQPPPAISAIASAAVKPITAETVSHVHPDPNAGPVSIWDAGESNRDLATLVADNTSIPKEKIMGYMADDHPEPPESATGAHYHEPRKGRRQIRRNSSVESRRKIFVSMKRPVEQPRRPSTVEAESGNTMSSVSSDTIGSKQKTASAKASSDSGSDVWRSAEIKASVMAASAAAATGGISESKTSVMSAEMDERSNADISKASGSQFSLLDFEMDRSTAAGLMSSAQVGQALASAGFGGQQQQPTNQQSPTSQQNQEEMEASQYLVSVSEGLMDSSPDRSGRKSSIKEEDDEEEDEE